MPLPGRAHHPIRHQQAALRHADGHQESEDEGSQAARPRPTRGGSVGPTDRIERVYIPQKAKQTQMFDGTAKEAAAKLVEKLKFEVRVI